MAACDSEIGDIGNSSSDDGDARDKLQLKSIDELCNYGRTELIEYIKKLHRKLTKTSKKLKKCRQKLKDALQNAVDLSLVEKHIEGEEECDEKKPISKQNTQHVGNDEINEDNENSREFKMSPCSEDCDDSANDATFCTSFMKDDSDDSDEEQVKQSSTVFRPLLEKNFSDNTIIVEEKMSVFNSEDCASTQTVPTGDSTFDLETTLGDSILSTSNVASDPLMLGSSKGKKRPRQPEKWKRNITKKKRNSGQRYETSETVRPERKMKDTCVETCKLKCSQKFSEAERNDIFVAYWELGDIEKQRQFIANCIQIVEPKYRYVRTVGPRAPRQKNTAYFFQQGANVTRVCKVFFKNTLDINDRHITTVVKKCEKMDNLTLEPDQRGKHGNHRKLDANLKAGLKEFIDKIPKIENKTITSIYKDYIEFCKEKNEPFCSYISFYRSFMENFNI